MRSLWQDTQELPSFEKLKRDVKTDVLIIGGGIMGILTAYFLEKEGVDYLLVEKDRICSETTANTTAKITFQHGLIYNKLLKHEGAGRAMGYLRTNKLAFDKFQEICTQLDCDYEIKDNYVYTTDDRQKLEDEITALDKIGYKAFLCDGLEIPVKTAGAVKFEDQAQFHPLKFISQISKNLNIRENTLVYEMIGNLVVTDRYTIHADKIIVATHFPFINKHGSYFLKLYQHRSYITALDNAQELNGMYVDDNLKGLSFRNYNNYLLLSGGGHRTGKKGGNWEVLRKFAKKHYPESLEKYFWAAQDCMSLDNIPYIGRYSKSTVDLYTASGFNKWGMTGAMSAAMMLTDKVLGRQNIYEEVFSPSRSILKPQLAVNLLESSINLINITKKRCPHLGCALKWNQAEHSWDCPCHGSRFSETGQVLNNPANEDLKK